MRVAGWIVCVWIVLLNPVSFPLALAQSPGPEFPGQKSDWNGFDRFDFELAGHPLMVVAPKAPASGLPWVWHGEFFGHKPAPDVALLEKGFHIVYAKLPDMLGSPAAVRHWDVVYEELTGRYGFCPKVALVGLSRGGLYCYNWAIANPDKVACIYGDAPVCDFKSWPGGQGAGPGDPRNWELVQKLWGFESEQAALDWKGNPVDNLRPLAVAGVPLLHVFGDADEVVPWEENTGLIATRYPDLGGVIELIRKPGVKHHPHGLEDSTPIVDFIERHSLPGLEVSRSGRGHRITGRRAEDNGVQVFSIESPFQRGETEVSILLPDHLKPGTRYPVLFILPVEAAREDRWGNGLAEILRADLHNRYGVICVSPTFSDLPWYADHPDDIHLQQEKYLLEVVLPLLRWQVPAARQDRDGRLLLGFSKSGWGAWSLLLRHPDLFGKAAAWDAPLMLDAPGKYGSGAIFGTPENFSRYHLSQLVEQSAGLHASPRLIHLGSGNFQEEHVQMEALLNRLRVPHVYFAGPVREHHWSSGWVPEAVSLLTSGF